jgi:large subunit ribosomal protein L9
MKIILLRDIKGIGKKYEVKDVSDGYVRNFLIPGKLVEPANASALEKLKRERAAWEAERQKTIVRLQAESKKMDGTVLTFKLKVGKKKEVFGSVTQKDLTDALRQKGFKDIEAAIKHPIKTLGEHAVELDLGEGIKTSIKVLVQEES